jgi:hypothetical protein
MTGVTYRLAELVDHRFVVDAWCGSYRDAYTAGLIQVDDWYAIMIPQLEKVLARPDVRVVVASLPGAADGVADLLGFIVADTVEQPALIYYVFTKEHYRCAGGGEGQGRRKLWDGPGVARGLFAAIGVDPARPFNYVCSTPSCRILARKIPMARWKPLLGRFPKSERRRR